MYKIDLSKVGSGVIEYAKRVVREQGSINVDQLAKKLSSIYRLPFGEARQIAIYVMNELEENGEGIFHLSYGGAEVFEHKG